MMLDRLMNEIEVLIRSEVRFGISARMPAAALVIDYVTSFDFTEPPLPTYPEYVWPKGSTYFD